MKKLALIFLMFLGLAGVAQAQQTQDEEFVLTMPLIAPCSPKDEALALLRDTHGEIPFAQGVGLVWNSKIKEYVEVRVLVFLNPDTFSFTVGYEVPEDKLICILTLGDNFQPIPRGNSL